MPMSEEAMCGLRAAVEYNPQAAQFLLDALRGLPNTLVPIDNIYRN